MIKQNPMRFRVSGCLPLRRIGFEVALLVCMLSATTIAFSQQNAPKPTGGDATNKKTKATHPSFSNADDYSKVKVNRSSILSNVAAEETTADAITAQTLNNLYSLAGNEHYEHGEWNHTINLYQIVMEGDPHDTDAYDNSAYLLWSSDRKDQANAMLKRGLDANPQSYDMYVAVGAHYWIYRKDYKAATPYYEKATKFADCKALTWKTLAHCYEKANQWDKAVQAYEQACRDVTDPVAPILLKKARARLAQQKSGK